MPSLADSIYIFVLALLLFGPKKLPVLARELGKWIGEFRRASNEFKLQMEEELRLSEQADRQKKIEEMQANAPPPRALVDTSADAVTADDEVEDQAQSPAIETTDPQPSPIATSGEVSIMPPATGLPTPRSSPSVADSSPADDDLTRLIESIPSADPPAHDHDAIETENATHG